MHLDFIPTLLGWAVLLPLLSFAIILVAGPRMGKAGSLAGVFATSTIFLSFVLSLVSLGIWLAHHGPPALAHQEEAQTAASRGTAQDHSVTGSATDNGSEHAAGVIPPLAGEWYILGQFGRLRLTIGYYVDALTIAMFCMVTFISLCIHVYSTGYMHDELHEVADPEVPLSDGSAYHRPGRYSRFFQFLSLFCFSMLGLVVAGNLAMTFVFWELVGICSYFLIGFYVERVSASTAANKAFIVNRIGDFGMIVGLMALWTSMGTFAYGDVDGQPGIFSQLRPAQMNHALVVPEGMVRLAARRQIAQLAASMREGAPADEIQGAIDAQIGRWQTPGADRPGGFGYGLLVLAGAGIFCGCIGKSAQFPLHVWLPDAMEGPTPVSALVHSATMVAAGVYLVARFFPVFAPEVLLVIAIVGCITLFLAATIAIVATDIKRVLAYSTISQLGYMMMALGLGGWLAGVLHLFTHAFFKSLMFMCSGSVIHAVHTNQLPLMGGLRRKMPWTAYTMLVGCLAIAGAGIPLVIGLSGYYSKDAILEQALLFGRTNPGAGSFFYIAATAGAVITAFYMFRLWYLAFAGQPRDEHRYDHAHESPPEMYGTLVLLAVFAIGVAWTPKEAVGGAMAAAAIFLLVFYMLRANWTRATAIPFLLCAAVLIWGMLWQTAGLEQATLRDVLEQARPPGTAQVGPGRLVPLNWPDEHATHELAIRGPVSWTAFLSAIAGILLATIFYCWKWLSAEDVAAHFRPVYRFLLNKWWFDELYDWLFVQPTLLMARAVAAIDRRWIDEFIDGSARAVRQISATWDTVFDRAIVDGLANKLAAWTYGLGLAFRRIQTGSLRQYVLFIVVAMVAVFVLVSFFWGFASAS